VALISGACWEPETARNDSATGDVSGKKKFPKKLKSKFSYRKTVLIAGHVAVNLGLWRKLSH
jgi:hypothetical protein